MRPAQIHLLRQQQESWLVHVTSLMGAHTPRRVPKNCLGCHTSVRQATVADEAISSPQPSEADRHQPQMVLNSAPA
jgi:hypothetical protein